MTLKELTEDYQYFLAECLEFRRQNLVNYVLPGKRRFPMRKQHLIAAIRFFLSRLAILGHKNDIKQGFVLDKFKYYELSTYLFGIVNYYSSLIGLPIHSMNISRFSHLPHDVMKSEKKIREIEVAFIKDMFGASSYCCVICDKPWSALSLDVLRQQLLDNYDFLRKYNIVFDVK